MTSALYFVLLHWQFQFLEQCHFTILPVYYCWDQPLSFSMASALTLILHWQFSFLWQCRFTITCGCYCWSNLCLFCGFSFDTCSNALVHLVPRAMPLCLLDATAGIIICSTFQCLHLCAFFYGIGISSSQVDATMPPVCLGEICLFSRLQLRPLYNCNCIGVFSSMVTSFYYLVCCSWGQPLSFSMASALILVLLHWHHQFLGQCQFTSWMLQLGSTSVLSNGFSFVLVLLVSLVPKLYPLHHLGAAARANLYL